MYLAPTPRRRTLGAFRMRQGLDGSQWSRSAQRRRTWAMNGLRGLGNGDPTAVITMQWPDPPVPSSSGAQPDLPANNIPQVLQNIFTSASPDPSPLDYVSPQAAIAAGLDSQFVYQTWTRALTQFPTQQAAIAAGVPSGVVTQLWSSSRELVAASTGTTYTAAMGPQASWLDQSTLGIANKWLLAASAGVFGLTLVAKGRKH